MADIVTPDVRSRMMSGIRGKDTKPELVIRKALHKLGYRYRLHIKELPGKPDLFFPKYKAVIFIHGCFWHGHDCHLCKIPQTNRNFWEQKIRNNHQRDLKTTSLLMEVEVRVLEIWECALRGKEKLSFESIVSDCIIWLKSDSSKREIRGIHDSADSGHR